MKRATRTKKPNVVKRANSAKTPEQGERAVMSKKPTAVKRASEDEKPIKNKRALSTSNLKTIVRGAYDIQKLRIQMGNRIVGNFKAKLGQEPGEKEDTIDAEGKQILATLRVQFNKLTDGVATFPKQSSFVGDEVISDYTELCLVAQYVDLEKHEMQHFRRLGNILKEYRLWNEFLDGVKGVGPAMGGVILSEIDIHKAKYPSSLWAYAGLDAVTGWKLVETFDGGGKPPDWFPVTPENIALSEDGASFLLIDQRNRQSIARYEQRSSGRSKRKEHLREIEYTDKDGNPAKRVGITFNPFLKTKLVGVLGPSFLKCANDIYAPVYYDTKHRLENHAKYGTQNDKKKDDNDRIITSKLRRHNMAMRKCVKSFLLDLYLAWRKIEGLPVSAPYHEAKLGMKHGERDVA